MDLDPVRTRVLKLIENRKDTDLKHASLALGRNAAYLHQFIFRGTPKVLPEDLREGLAKYLGIDEAELRHRKVPPRKPRSKHDTNGNRAAAPLRTAHVPEGFVGIAEIDVRASAGPGAFNEDLEETKVTWLFPEACRTARVSCAPQRASDDHRRRRLDGTPVVERRSYPDRYQSARAGSAGHLRHLGWHGVVAKRVEHIPNSEPPKVVIKSVNPEYQAYERIAEEVNVVGRVVWAARRL